MLKWKRLFAKIILGSITKIILGVTTIGINTYTCRNPACWIAGQVSSWPSVPNNDKGYFLELMAVFMIPKEAKLSLRHPYFFFK